MPFRRAVAGLFILGLLAPQALAWNEQARKRYVDQFAQGLLSPIEVSVSAL